jgi:hypothetical protein
MEKKVVSGDDLAIGIQFSVSLPENRSIAFSTACPQDIDDQDLNGLLRRISNAADTLDATYRLRALRKYEEQLTNEILTTRQQIANYEEQAANEYQARGRQGPLKLTASQEAALKNFKTTEEGHTFRLKKLREEITELELLTKASVKVA